MGAIHQLDEHLSNMIAAGEVVERPSGIVKELVENCLDAHAKQIQVKIVQGGIDTITIVDDGDGMDGSDATLAFERHATSKIKEVDDLWKINTMGFRGEALPSIASVSHVLMRTSNGLESSEVEINYGTLVHAIPIGTPKGTMIEIKNLFQKTPARFKHLKSPQYEFSLICDVVQKFAIAHPEVSFDLTHEDRSIFKTNGNGNLREVVMQIYDRESAKSAVELHGEDQDYKIEGLALQPQYNRATKYYVLLYINGRMIRNYHLQKAVMDAYSPYLPKDRYPIAIVNMIMDAQLVDVNVHPSKWEIRLSKEKQLEKLVYTTIQQAFMQHMEIPNVQVNKDNKKEKVELQELNFTYERDDKINQLHEEVNQSFVQPEPTSSSFEPTIKEELKETISGEMKPEVQEKENNYHVEEEIAQTLFKDIAPVEEAILPMTSSQNPSFPQLEVIGQFHRCYIIAQGEKGLYIIDQHAAQERYHYEMIKEQINQGIKDCQPLLLPITIDSNLSAVSQADQINALMEQIGIHLEVFGNTTFICRELPIWMKNVDEVAFLQDMIDFYLRDAQVNVSQLRKHAIATMACHSSIRFNRTLSMNEMRQVIEDLKKCEQPFHCPHGRPTLICIEEKDLIHDFERG